MEWLTLEVFDSDAAAWTWRDRHDEVLVSSAIGFGARYWEWHEHPFGVALEICLPDDAAVEAFRSAPSVRAALERAPNPANGVLVYRGRGGGAGAGVPRTPRPAPFAGAVALPEPEDRRSVTARTVLALPHPRAPFEA
ncbi:MAG TPA: hypothetical protein VLR26_03085 [Frankiaceae bacterium]|nr:hypothetical protein [Frankiaceae bacterium]